MLFNSFEFLIFFPVVTILYFLVPFKYRWMLLLLASCVFYMFFVPAYIFILLITILIDYYAALFINRSEGKKRKRYLIISILSTCLVLFIFKYFNFFNENFRAVADTVRWNYPIHALRILLPIGLSFHTFQSLSYVIEVYRGKQKPEPHFGIYSLYVMFYPQLVAGPIERPQNMLHQFHEAHNFNYDNVTNGLKRMLWGYFKKMVVADRCAIYVSAVYNNYSHHNGTSLLLAAILFAFQIYCDFSGYSDIALGSAEVMGFKLMTNFKRPYFSKTLSEFWRRWHISLSTWFSDYLYIPMGGNRVAMPRWCFNIFFTFVISGLWHGASWTFVIWGALNGLYLVINILLKKPRQWFAANNPFSNFPRVSVSVQTLFTFFLFSVSLIFFRAESFKQALGIFHKIVFERGPLFNDKKTLIYSFCFILIVLVTEFFEEHQLFNNFSLYKNKLGLVRHLTYFILVIVIILFGVLDGGQFIYFQF